MSGQERGDGAKRVEVVGAGEKQAKKEKNRNFYDNHYDDFVFS